MRLSILSDLPNHRVPFRHNGRSDGPTKRHEPPPLIAKPFRRVIMDSGVRSAHPRNYPEIADAPDVLAA